MSPLSDTQQSNAKLGLRLFGIYLLLYLGFVFLSAFSASTMEMKVLAGLNLAIVYGFGLIVAALLMALLYGAMCRSEPNVQTPPDQSDVSKSIELDQEASS